MVSPSSNQNRSGLYIKQPTGYKAFIPNDLPPNPPVEIDSETSELLSRADRALGRLDGATEILPNASLFVAMYVRKEAVLSSQIEGTQASLIDILEYEAGGSTSEIPGDIEEVVNYVAAMNHGLERLKQIPVSLRLIKEIHAKLMQGVRGGERSPGEFRTSQNWIGPPGCTLRTAKFIPPPPAHLMKHLGSLENFLHDPTPMPVLIKVALAHAQFETIHPFLDGNGRTGRLLITFLLCEKEILQRPLLYLSYYFKQYRTEYYDRLQKVRDHGDWEGWLKFFLRGVFEVSQEATATARRIVNLREEHREQITGKLGNRAGNSLKLLEKLFWSPVISVEQAAKEIGLSISNANRLVNRMCELNLLQETTGQRRNRRFAYRPYLDLFRDSHVSDSLMNSTEGTAE